MSVLSKFVRKNKKGLLKVGRVILAGVTKGKSEKVIQNAKGIGAAVKTYKNLSKRPAKSEAAAMAKAMAVSPPKIVGISSVAATTMPGGAPLRGLPKRSVIKQPKAPAPKQAKKARKAPSGKRSPPKGGKDFKALSASWKAAGKPGTWLAWVKSH